MIIAISGPSSTGKTTVVNDLSLFKEELKDILGVRNVSIVKETIRELFDENYKDKYSSFEELLDSEADMIEFEILIAEDQIQMYDRFLVDSETLYICDRCPLDTMVYLALNYRFASPEVQAEYRDRYLKTMKSLESRVQTCTARTFVVYRTLPLNSVEDDGFRPMQYMTRRESEVIGFDLLLTARITLPEDRIQRVSFILNDLKGGK